MYCCIRRGYREEIIAEVFKKIGYILHVVLRKGHVKGDFKPIGKRWIVERTFSWDDNHR
jgi:hypothetical protein